MLRVSFIEISIEMLVDGPSGGNKSNESPIVAEPSSSTSVILNVITVIRKCRYCMQGENTEVEGRYVCYWDDLMVLLTRPIFSSKIIKRVSVPTSLSLH